MNKNPNFSIADINVVIRNKEHINGVLDSIKDKLEKETFTMEDIENLNPNERGYPRYLPNTFDEYGIPTDNKLKKAYENIVLGLCKINEFEGGVRGGKDVIAIALFSELLMIHPSSNFLVLGQSLEHAIKTVFESDGFGILYTIPHGRLSREQVDGAQRVVYRFLDYYGIEKKILIYGNSQKNDYEKYQGFTIGACYVNEGTNQEIKGLREALQRMITSIMPVMVITQNPVGKMNDYYTDFEKTFLPNLENISAIEQIQELYKDEWKKLETQLYEDMVKDVKAKRKEFLEKHGVPRLSNLSEAKQVQFNQIEIRTRMAHEKFIRDLKVKDVLSGFPDKHELANLSLKKVMHYQRAFKNPNDIENNIDFSYYHLTLEDNKALTDTQKSEAKKMFPKGSSLYDQRILGIRKSVDKAVYDNFSDDNIFSTDINVFKTMETTRCIVIDFGAGKASGIADYEIDYNTGEIWQTREAHLTPENLKAIGKSITEPTIYEFYLDVLKKGKKNAILIIDSANKHLINYFEDNMGIPVMLANKRYNMPSGIEQSEGFNRIDTGIVGIPLVKLGWDLKKIHIHESCTETINELQSYEFAPENEKTGKVEVIKVNDEFCDTLRYVANTMLGGATYWYSQEGEVVDNNEQHSELSSNERTQDEERYMERPRRERNNRFREEEHRLRQFGGQIKYGKF